MTPQALGLAVGALVAFVGLCVFVGGFGRALGGVGVSTPASPRSAPLLMAGFMLMFFGGTVAALALAVL